MEWLNRLGIILNFLAGFLLAPELIGLERIRRFEERMEKSASSWIKGIDPYHDFFIKRVFVTNRRMAFLRIFTGLTILIALMMASNETFNSLTRAAILMFTKWLLVNQKIAFIVLIIISALSLVFSFLMFRANKRLSEEDPRKREFHPGAVVLAPLTWPMLTLALIVLYLVRSLLYLILVIQILFVRIPAKITVYLLSGNDRLRR